MPTYYNDSTTIWRNNDLISPGRKGAHHEGIKKWAKRGTKLLELKGDYVEERSVFFFGEKPVIHSICHRLLDTDSYFFLIIHVLPVFCFFLICTWNYFNKFRNPYLYGIKGFLLQFAEWKNWIFLLKLKWEKTKTFVIIWKHSLYFSLSSRSIV